MRTQIPAAERSECNDRIQNLSDNERNILAFITTYCDDLDDDTVRTVIESSFQAGGWAMEMNESEVDEDWQPMYNILTALVANPASMNQVDWDNLDWIVSKHASAAWGE